MAREIFNRDNLMDYGKRGFRGGLSTLGDFRQFLLRGNVVDLAVGVVIGAAFNGVVQGLVTDVIKPLLGLLVDVNGVNGLDQTVRTPLGTSQVFLWSNLITVVISFIITAAVVYFLVVKPINALENGFSRLHTKAVVAPMTRDCPACFSTVNIKATRCAFCTSPLPPVSESPSFHQ